MCSCVAISAQPRGLLWKRGGVWHEATVEREGGGYLPLFKRKPGQPGLLLRTSSELQHPQAIVDYFSAADCTCTVCALRQDTRATGGPRATLRDTATYLPPPPPPCNLPAPCNPPPPGGGERSLGPKSTESTRCQRRHRNVLQGAEADLHCDTMVQFCGAIPPSPRGGEPSRHWWGDYGGGGGVGSLTVRLADWLAGQPTCVAISDCNVDEPNQLIGFTANPQIA